MSFAIIFLTSIAVAASLEAIEVSKLPVPTRSLSSYYHEPSNIIYLFGGLMEIDRELISNYDIYAFSISNNSLSKVGETPKEIGKFTRTHIIPASNSNTSSDLLLHYIVPQTDTQSSVILLFNGTDGTVDEVGRLPFELDFSTFSAAPNGEVYFFGGHYMGKNILKVDLESETIQWEVVGTIQQSFENGMPFQATVRVMISCVIMNSK